MGKLILVRHGESHGNRDRMFAVRPSELPLTELGYQQAREVAQVIARRFKAEVVIASPYLRARETAKVIAHELGLPIQIEPALYEREVGEYEGKSYDAPHTDAQFDPQRPWEWRPKGGESYIDVQARVSPVLDRLRLAHLLRDVVIVSHGGVMQTLWAHVIGAWGSLHVPPNCGIVLIEHTATGYGAPQVIGDAQSAADAGG